MKKVLISVVLLSVLALANTLAQSSGTPAFVTKDGEVWAFEGKTGEGASGLIFQSDGKIFDVRMMSGTWVSQRQNGTWTQNGTRGNSDWDDWTISVSGNTLTFSYSYINDEGEERTSRETYIKETGQDIVIMH